MYMSFYFVSVQRRLSGCTTQRMVIVYINRRHSFPFFLVFIVFIYTREEKYKNSWKASEMRKGKRHTEGNENIKRCLCVIPFEMKLNNKLNENWKQCYPLILFFNSISSRVEENISFRRRILYNRRDEMIG